MGNEAASNADLIQRPTFQPASITSCSVVTPINASNSTGLFRRPGIPPIPSPLTPSSTSASASASFHPLPISQIPAFFLLESMCPPLRSLPFPSTAATSSDNATEADRAHTSRGLAEAHHRSQNDVPTGFLPPFSSSLIANPSAAASGSPIALFPHMRSSFSLQQVNQEGEGDKDTESSDRKSEGGDATDDFFNAYMNLDNLDTLNSSAMEEKSEDRMRMNSSNASESEAENNVNEGGGGGEKKDWKKRSAVDLTPMSSRHYRSLSMDSVIGKLNFGVESSKKPPSTGNPTEALSRSGSMESNTSMDLLSGDFSSIELKKIMTNERLTEIALTDPKRVKRILANRQSAARSKERKLRYISELEYKVQTLQTETNTLSAQLTLLQRESAGLTSQNNELRIRLQSMEQQAQLRDALSEALTAEVQRLKLAAGEVTEAQLSKCLNQQLSVNPRIFPFHQLPNPQSTHLPLYQFQQHQQREEQQQSIAASKSGSKELAHEKPIRMS